MPAWKCFAYGLQVVALVSRGAVAGAAAMIALILLALLAAAVLYIAGLREKL